MMPHRTVLRLNRWLLSLTALLILMALPAAAQGNQHIVRRGETLFRIALRYGITVDALARANNLANPNQIYAGQALIIPAAGTEPVAAPGLPVASEAPIYHVVRPGETLGTIARQYGVSWQDIATRNNIANPNRILVGQQLLIMTAATGAASGATPPPAAPAPTVTTAPDTGQARTHIVQPGEHLSAIARRYGLSWPVLAQANGLVDPNHILVGQALVIPAGGSAAASTYFEPSLGQPSGPAPTVANGKQIIVDLSDQRIYAYQDGQLLRVVTVSTGLPGTPTVTGDFNVYWKLTSQTMSGPGYYLPGVPWVMYFYAGYAIHGTYWHNNFGRPMSHGCVNLPTDEAYWFFNFAEVGTPVRVVY
ncbi:MAG: LysM peptidoglycan-binding domain-containing protein [Anaerolineae bacterium]|nr:LysM peptidoglycan-binding domain-containing protein [Anaerolineae bacterium]